MKKPATVALLALALTGCVSESSLPQVYSPPAVETVTKEASAEDLSQAWADTQINHFLNGYGAASLAGFMEGTPHRNIDSWSSPEEGVLVVVLSSNNWRGKYLHTLSFDIMGKAGWEDPRLKKVRVTTHDGSAWEETRRTSIAGLH
ncbi:hypothetical protein ACIPUB_14790 [Paeniglutamicibacter sp. ORCA_105]|uniref:hypothetical protein n=1 Tax=Paeniglutamicibacter sp. ORCA_105 TaxID=3377336 RepID=UPI003894E70B